MELLFFAFIFIFGAIIGSFLNVVATRLGTGLSLSGRSLCLSCAHTLNWYDLIPFVSFLATRGRCRYCECKISWQYPVVEVLSGVLFTLLFIKFTPLLLLSPFGALILGYYLLLFSVLFIIGIYDFHHHIIPNTFVYLFVGLSFLGVPLFMYGSGLYPYSLGSLEPWAWLSAGPLLALPLASLWFISKGVWIGLGDAKLALGIGWMLGLSSGFAALFLSFWIGALAGLSLLAFKRLGALLGSSKHYTMKSELSFAPFLIIGAFIALYFDISFFDIQLLLTL